ncbi:MAG: transcriptional regulator NrdR [Opitutae bacterium]
MRCPKCSSNDTKVVDSRSPREGSNIRRRRECNECGHRFSTLEQVLSEDLIVLKRNGTQEPFEKRKLLEGLRKALTKCPCNREQVELLVSDTLENLQSEFDQEIPSRAIADALMNRLRSIDSTAYIRYACKYLKFQEAGTSAQIRQT